MKSSETTQKLLPIRPGLVLALLLLLSGCVLAPRGTGKVSLTFESGAKTILPTVTVASYLISFSGPEGMDPVSTTDSSPTIDVRVGTWDISVEGRDSDGDTVAVGGASGVVVSEGATTPVWIVLRAQTSGSGSIDVTVSWPSTVGPEVDAYAVTVDGEAVDAGAVSSGGSPLTWVRYVQDKASGSYTLCIDLKSSGGTVLRASVQEAVQVYKNLCSSATIVLTEADFTSAPVTPSGLAVAEGLGRLALSWVDNSHVETGYTVERGTDGVVYGVIDTVSAPRIGYEDITAVVGQTYYYRVRATNDIGASAASDPASGKVEPPVAGGTGALTFGGVSSSSITVNWQKASDNSSVQSALMYKVVRSNSDNVDTVAEAEANGTVVTDWTADIVVGTAAGLSPATVYYFNVLVRDTAGNTGAYVSEPQSSSPAVTRIIADHTIVDRYDDIPPYWINEVKKMWLNLPGESHAYGYKIGLPLLEGIDATFAVNVTDAGNPEGYTDQHLRASSATRTIYSGWQYYYGEENWYTSSTAIANTKNHLAYCNTSGLAITAFGFGWCWDMTRNGVAGTIDPVHQVRWAGSSVGGPEGDLQWGLDAADVALTGNSVCVDTYLAATQQYIDYCASNGYPTKVFFSTGPIDTEPSGEIEYQRELKHARIRGYVLASSDRILFDYADILAWNNSGVENTASWTDHGGTSRTFQRIHPDNRVDLGGGYVEDGDHIGQIGAIRLAKALWWMLARVAGWPGD